MVNNAHVLIAQGFWVDVGADWVQPLRRRAEADLFLDRIVQVPQLNLVAE